MNNFTTNTYEMKREILNFSKKVSKGLTKPEEKFIQDIEYGIKFEDLDDVIDASSKR